MFCKSRLEKKKKKEKKQSFSHFMYMLLFCICTLLHGSKPYMTEKRIGNYEQFQISQLTALKNEDFFPE